MAMLVRPTNLACNSSPEGMIGLPGQPKRTLRGNNRAVCCIQLCSLGTESHLVVLPLAPCPIQALYLPEEGGAFFFHTVLPA